jgi:hypothetical protein
VPPDALTYGVELTGLKSLYRLCDGERTLFLVDQEGRLVDIVAIAGWAAHQAEAGTVVPCADLYAPHAAATRTRGRVCLVLSRHQEIKVFAEGVQAFAFAHGRWRILDPEMKYSAWQAAVGAPTLARVLFQAAVNLAECRRGALFVVLDEPGEALGRLVPRHDVLGAEASPVSPVDPAPRDPMARRALHYLARDRDVLGLHPAVLEALASLDGALVVDRSGRLIAFGAILRHEAAAELPALALAEGARTSAALAASVHGSVLKVSEDGVLSCFLEGVRVWDF